MQMHRYESHQAYSLVFDLELRKTTQNLPGQPLNGGHTLFCWIWCWWMASLHWPANFQSLSTKDWGNFGKPLVTPSAFKFASGSPHQLTSCRLNSVAVLWSAKSGTIIQNSRSGNKTACAAFAKINTYKLTKWNSESDLPISQVNAAAGEWD